MGRKNDVAYDIFISYRRAGGAETAKHLRDVLTERGYRVFFDTDSLQSGNFNKKLFDVIDSCKDMIIILSPGSLDRCVNEGDWVRMELAYGLEHGKNIVPVMSNGFEFPESLPPDINDIRWQNGVAVNIEFFDAMINKLTTFLISKPVNSKKKLVLAAVGAAAVVLVCLVAFFIRSNSSASSNALGTNLSGGTSSTASGGTSSTSGRSDAKAEDDTQSSQATKVSVDYTLGDNVEVHNASSGKHEYDISVDAVHILPDSMKYDMWETYDASTTDLLGVQCTLNNYGYKRGSGGAVQPYQVLQDNTVIVEDADGFMLKSVSQMYHGSDGQYSCETTPTIPSGSKGRFCAIFYLDKGTSEVTLSIDAHDGTVYKAPVKL
ncbi:MAG: toll/interleukin-1 receptor domain-containing protein [Atopobiaceae bacterium]|nr:toll/interleukin-1 receptor domain-containing protein [Atopobiaceae bacterium]